MLVRSLVCRSQEKLGDLVLRAAHCPGKIFHYRYSLFIQHSKMVGYEFARKPQQQKLEITCQPHPLPHGYEMR